VEARKHCTIQRDRIGKELQRDNLVELQVFGLVHLAHPTLAGKRDDAIPGGDQRAGYEFSLAKRRAWSGAVGRSQRSMRWTLRTVVTRGSFDRVMQCRRCFIDQVHAARWAAG
jgi:hypothetical protein